MGVKSRLPPTARKNHLTLPFFLISECNNLRQARKELSFNSLALVYLRVCVNQWLGALKPTPNVTNQIGKGSATMTMLEGLKQ